MGAIIIIIIFVDFTPAVEFDINNWAEISVACGASILTVVGIITSVLTSNENDRRTEFIDIQNKILSVIDGRLNYIDDKEIDTLYNNAKNKINQLIEKRGLMKYNESFIGFASFLAFLISAYYAIIGLSFRVVFGYFLIGLGLIFCYLLYCVLEFIKMDAFNEPLSKRGKIEKELTVKINGVKANLLDDPTKKEKVIESSPEFIYNNIEIDTTFEGLLRNGFFHVIIGYTNDKNTHIPHRITSLLNFGFIDDYDLAVYGGEDTGILHADGKVNVNFYIPLRNKINSDSNKLLVKDINFPLRGRRDVYEYPSIPKDVFVKYIILRYFEDPYYQPKYKRSELDMLKIRITRVMPEL